jgi:hypothetical protein
MFAKKQYFSIEKVNFEKLTGLGTCQLNNKNHSFKMVWSVRNHPIEQPGMPGSPYPVLVRYTIFDEKNLVNGEFVYELPSGTLPYVSSMGIPCGVYKSNNYYLGLSFVFNLDKDCMELCIKPRKHKN